MKYVDSYTKLANFGHELLERHSLEDGLPMIAAYAKNVIKADRCSIYIYNSKKDQLWTTLADGVEKIIIDAHQGIAGATLKERKPVLVNNPYQDVRFLPKFDHETGYRTRNIACVPIFNSSRTIIGILQLLNKNDGDFDQDDVRFMIFFAHYISGYIELSSIFREDEA